MLNLFLSRSFMNKLKKLKENIRGIFKKIKNIKWSRILITLLVIGIVVFGDFLICISVDSSYEEKRNNDKIVKIEQTVLSHKRQIIDMALAYLANYNELKDKSNLELEFDDVDVTFDRNSEKKVIVLAEAGMHSIEFILKQDNLEKIEDDTKEEPEEDPLAVKIILCTFLDLVIILISCFCLLLIY